MSIEIGAVKAIVGKFWIHSANGESHLAVVGEMLHQGDRIVGDNANAANATLSLALVGNMNKDIVLGANDVLMLDQTFLKDVLTMEDASVNKASLVAAWNASSEELSIATEENKDALALADTEIGDGETAAGGAATDGQITPATFDERTGAFGDVNTNLLGGVNTGGSDTLGGTNTPDLNDRPVVADVSATVGEALGGTNTITGQLLAFDADLTDTHTFFAVEGSLTVDGTALEGVSFIVNQDGTYVVSGDFNHLAVDENAVVSFQYFAVDNGLSVGAQHDSLPATVTLTVTGTNDQPIVTNVAVTATEGNGLETIHAGTLVLATDLDTTDTHTFQQTGAATVTTSGGAVVTGLSVVVNADGSYTVKGNFDALAAGETATVTFKYTATDDSGIANATSEAKTVTLTVTGTNDQPIVANVAVTATEGNGLETIHAGTLVLATDLDTTDTHTFQQTGAATVTTSGGAVVTGLSVVVNADGSYTVKGNFDALAAGETATVTFKYTATDDSGIANATSEAKTVTLTVTGTNDVPTTTVVVNDIATTNEDASIVIDVLANDTDIDSAASPVASVTQGANGTVILNGDGTLTYTPNANYNGADSFTYTNAEGATATVSVTVNALNDPSVVVNDAAVATEGRVLAQTVSVLTNDTDVDSAILTVAQVATNSSGAGVITVNGVTAIATALGGTVIMRADGTYTYTAPVRNHADAAADVDSFSYKASDGSLSSDWTTVSITIADTAPHAIDNNIAVAFGATTTGNVMTNDEVGTDSTIVTSVTYKGTTHTVTSGGTTFTTDKGIFTIKADGTYSYDSKIETSYGGGTQQTTTNWTGVTLSAYKERSYFDINTNGSPTVTNLITTPPDGVASIAQYGAFVTDGSGHDGYINSQNSGPEALVIDLGSPVNSLNIMLYFHSNATGTANWAIYDANGALLEYGSKRVTDMKTTNNSIYGIADVEGASFKYLVLYGEQDTGGVQFALGQVYGINYNPSASVTEDFTYTITDADGDVSRADLSITTGTADAAITWTGTAGNDTYTGKEGNDTISGIGGNDVIHGGSGSDTIDGGVGSDSLYGDAGSDTLIFDAADAVMDGGSGTDMLVLMTGTHIDFSAIGHVVKNIEIIDLSQNGAHTLDKLTINDVLDMTDPASHDLIILGGTDDTVNLQNTTDGAWTKTTEVETATINGAEHTFDIYTNSRDATVLVKVEQSIDDHIV